MAQPIPQLGWYTLSEQDRAAAHRLLARISTDGTRDELGLGHIHFAFADRFFPGTSVQHAQLRYVFFVAWSYQELLERSSGGPFPFEALTEIEKRYSKRLMSTVGPLPRSGISGWTRYKAGELPAIRASSIYWAALRSWSMITPIAQSGEPPSEGQLQGQWTHLAPQASGDERLTARAELFPGIPSAPPNWRHKSGRLDFDLSKEEALYLRELWSAVGKDGGSKPTLMSKLAERNVKTSSLWSASVRRVATNSEKNWLDLAERAASLACIARGAYFATIEMLRNEEVGAKQNKHAEALAPLVKQHRVRALELDIDELREDIGMDETLTQFLHSVYKWVADSPPLTSLRPVLTMRERDLKNDRAYLVNKERRQEWMQSDIGAPLDYRWPVVREMIERVRAPG